MASNLPEDPNKPNANSHSEDDKKQVLNVEHWHYHANDLAELAKIAEKSPELAEKIVDKSDKVNQRKEVSYRFSLGATIALLVSALGTVAYLAVNVGIFAVIGAAFLIMTIALLIRVILTGEWSETSWFGKGIHHLFKRHHFAFKIRQHICPLIFQFHRDKNGNEKACF